MSRPIALGPARRAAPAQALCGRDAVVHLAGENVAQRWTPAAKRAIRETRVRAPPTSSTGCAAPSARPRVLVSSSAIGYYGPHGEEPLDEEAPARQRLPGRGLRRLGGRGRARRASSACASCRSAPASCSTAPAARSGRCCRPSGSASAGPVAGGRQYISWIHAERRRRDHDRRARRRALERAGQRDRARALHQPRLLTVPSAACCTGPPCCPCPAFAMRALYGEMAEIVTTGARVDARQGARARLRVPPPRARRGAALALGDLDRPSPPRRLHRRGCALARRRRGSRVSMITRQGRLLSRYAAVGPIRCSPLGAWIVDQ